VQAGANSKRVIPMFLAFFAGWLLCGGFLSAQTIVKVVVAAAKVRERADIASPAITTVSMSTLLASQGKEGRWFKVDLPPDKDGRVLTGYIHESSVKILGSEEERPAAAAPAAPPAVVAPAAPAPPAKPKIVEPAPVQAEQPEERPRPTAAPAVPPAAPPAERPAGKPSFLIRPYLKVGFLLTPPSADDLGYVSADAGGDLDQYLTVNKGNFGAGLQVFLPVALAPSLKLGLDVGFHKLFSSRFDTGAADISFIYEDYDEDSDYDVHVLGLAEMVPNGSPFFLQGGLGGHFVHWSWTENYESKYQSIHETKSGTDFVLGLMAAAGTSLKVGDRVSLPISIRLDYLFRYGSLLTAGLVVGLSFR
jgi:hypothetical protein